MAAEPQGYEATQEPSEFEPGRALYVDAWLESDKVIYGRLTARSTVPATVGLEIHSGDMLVYAAKVDIAVDGTFAVGPVAPESRAQFHKSAGR
jgi:hypothetical protein